MGWGDGLDQRGRNLLRQRAQRLRLGGADLTAGARAQDVALVQLAGTLLALPATAVVEIVPPQKALRLPRMPAWLPSLIAFRGQTIAVVDLATWLGAIGKIGGYAILRHENRLLALAIDAAAGFRSLEAKDFGDEASAELSIGKLPLAQVTRDLLPILNVALLFADPRLQLQATA